jgi:hypothetical protein
VIHYAIPSSHSRGFSSKGPACGLKMLPGDALAAEPQLISCTVCRTVDLQAMGLFPHTARPARATQLIRSLRLSKEQRARVKRTLGLLWKRVRSRA